MIVQNAFLATIYFLGTSVYKNALNGSIQIRKKDVVFSQIATMLVQLVLAVTPTSAIPASQDNTF
jgi:hypothetical protein